MNRLEEGYCNFCKWRVGRGSCTACTWPTVAREGVLVAYPMLYQSIMHILLAPLDLQVTFITSVIGFHHQNSRSKKGGGGHNICFLRPHSLQCLRGQETASLYGLQCLCFLQNSTSQGSLAMKIENFKVLLIMLKVVSCL